MYKYKLIGKKINLYIIYLIAILLIIRASSPAFAQTLPKQNLSITPIIQEITLIPNTAYSYPLLITNLADKPMGIHIDINGFDPTQEGSQGFTPQASPLVSWTTISEKDTIIPPLSQKQLMITITPSIDAKERGYYETFTITPFISQQQTVKTPLVLTRFIGVVFATVGTVHYDDLAKKVTIQKFDPTKIIFGQTKANLSLQVRNAYFTHFIAKPFLSITPLFGAKRTVTLEEKHIFPGSTRSWDISLPLPTQYIFYKATIAVFVGNGNQILAQTYFFVLPQQVLIALCIACALIVITLMRKRLWKFSFVLLKG